MDRWSLIESSAKRVLVLSVLPGYAAATFAWILKIAREPSIRDPTARPPRGKRLLASGDFHPLQLVASNFVPFERSLIGGLRGALGGGHTPSRAAGYTFPEGENGHLSIPVLVRNELPPPPAYFQNRHLLA